MDEFFGLRAEMEAAIRQDDIARDRFDRFERKWAEREALLAADDIEEPQREPEPQPPPQQQSAAMDDESSAAWNDWLGRSVMKIMDKVVVPVIAEETRKMLDDEVKKLQAEIGVLRSEISVMRSAISGNVSLMGRGKSDAA